MDKTSIMISYMLRCCREQGLLSVYLRQVQSGEEKYFHSLESAMEYIRQQLNQEQEREVDSL